MNNTKLSERVRPDCEAATWVIEEIKRLEAALEAKAAPVGERVAFEAWAASVGYHTERDMFQREKYQSTLTWELWRVWQAGAAYQRAQQPCPEPEYPGQDGKLKGVKDGAADGKKKQKEMEAQL